jgi:hypothetical protein
MTLLALYGRLSEASTLTQARADEIVAAARPMAMNALRRSQESLEVVAREVLPVSARGGSVIPAWPHGDGDGSVTIEFVSDWGAMLSAWRALLDSSEFDDLLRSGQRLWIGIANDVMQLFVPDPPDGTYSMVRHHALMLVAATVWLGPDSTRRWLDAHSRVARRFLSGAGDLWQAIDAAEAGLRTLLDDPRARLPAKDVVAWLDRDAEALAAYQAYLGAASVGVAALLAGVSEWTPDYLSELICHRHKDPDFNRREIERFASAVSA